MKRKFIIIAAISLIAVSLVAGTLLAGLACQKEETNLYTYPLSVEDKTYIITLEAN
jgi:hypothetical protein